MSESNRVVLIGGHGKVGLLAAGTLGAAGFAVDSIIRNPDHADDVRKAGGNPVVLDIESADVDALARAFEGAKAVVFSAGAGGGDPQRTHAVDYEAAVRAMKAAEQAGVRRFVMVSYAGADRHVHELDPSDPFYPYARAKHDADAELRKTGLDYTILGPALLTLEPASGKIMRAEEGGEDYPEERRVTSRANVAEVIAHVVRTGEASRQTVNFYDGETPIADLIGQA